MLLLLLRFAVRIKTVGIRGFQGDDFFALGVIAMYTCDAATVHIVCRCIPAPCILSNECQTADRESADYAGSNVEAELLAATRRKYSYPSF